MLYQRYFLRMNQSNMTHVLGLLAGLAIALGFLLGLSLTFTSSAPILELVQRPVHLAMALTLIVCLGVYAGQLYIHI